MPLIFPPRNLPNDSIPWARTVETEILKSEVSVQATDETINNVRRAFSSQLAVQSDQINELYDRSISELPMPNVTATQAVPGVSTLFIPSSQTRTGVLTVNSEFSYSGGTGNGFLTIRQDGVIRARALGIITQNPPPGWPQGAVSMGFQATIPTGGTTFTATIEVVPFSGTFSVTSIGLTLGIYYGNRV